MLSEERRREILEMLQSEGRVLVGALASRFRTSQITIRKDLEFLQHEGQLERTHGGALPVKTGALRDRSIQEKEQMHRREKLRIAVREAKKYPELAKAHKPRSAWEWPKGSLAEKEARAALTA